MARRTGLVVVLAVTCAVLVGVLASLAVADSGNRFRAQRMLGTFEVPIVSSPGASGRFEARLQGSTVHYELTYSGLSSSVTQAHIHLGQPFVSAGIAVWLCGTGSGMLAGPAGTPTCPGPTSGTVEDSFVAADVVGPAGQGIGTGEFTELLAAMRAGNTYANVHSTNFGPGEIRGQLRASGGDDDDD